MSKRAELRLITLVFLVIFSFLQFVFKQTPQKKVLSTNEPSIASNSANFLVIKVVDGDTIDVMGQEKRERVRVLGINTPETVDPRKTVECFGKQASEKAKSILQGQSVSLIADPTQSNIDRYGRLVRYIFLSNGVDYGLDMIKQGYAYEYTYDKPYKFQSEYKIAQENVEREKVGLWADGVCN